MGITSTQGVLLLYFAKNAYKQKEMISTEKGLTWLMTMGGGGTKQTMGIRSQIKQSCQKGGKYWFEPVFYLALFNSVAKQKLFLGRKNTPPPRVRLRLLARRQHKSVPWRCRNVKSSTRRYKQVRAEFVHRDFVTHVTVSRKLKVIISSFAPEIPKNDENKL